MNPEKKEVVQALFQESRPFESGVDRASFRVRHRTRLKALEELVDEGYVRLQGDRYLVDLLALREVNSSDTERFLKDCEAVFLILRERYIEDQKEMIAVGDLASRSTLEEERFRTVLDFLHECFPVLGGMNGFKLNEPSARVLPSETLLVLENFDMLCERLQSFKGRRAAVAAQGSLITLQSDVAQSKEAAQPKAKRARGQRFRHLPVGLRGLMEEVVVANEEGLVRLCAMGVRAAIDVWCDDVAQCDLGNFPAKLKELETRDCITSNQREHLNAVVQLGHASAHRGFGASRKIVGDCLDLLERVLKSHYQDPEMTKRLTAVTPPRQRPSRGQARNGEAESS